MISGRHPTRRRPVYITLVAAVAVGIGSGVAASSSGPPILAAKQALLNAPWPPPGASPPARKDPSAIPPPAAPTPPPNAGRVILESQTPVQVPLPAGVFSATSMWSDLRGSTKIEIFGGASATNPATGEIFVAATDQSTGLAAAPSGLYEDPSGAGALTLTAVTGNTVSFTTSRGTSGQFDLAATSFSGG